MWEGLLCPPLQSNGTTVRTSWHGDWARRTLSKWAISFKMIIAFFTKCHIPIIVRTANWAINCLESFISVLLFQLMCEDACTRTHTYTLSLSLTIWGNLLIAWLPVTKIMKRSVSMSECLVVVDLLASSLPTYIQPKTQPLEAPSVPSPTQRVFVTVRMLSSPVQVHAHPTRKVYLVGGLWLGDVMSWILLRF